MCPDISLEIIRGAEEARCSRTLNISVHCDNVGTETAAEDGAASEGWSEKRVTVARMHSNTRNCSESSGAPESFPQLHRPSFVEGSWRIFHNLHLLERTAAMAPRNCGATMVLVNNWAPA